MKNQRTFLVAALVAALALPATAEQAAPAEPAAEPAADKLETHRTGSVRLADEQDELSADVQQLMLEQTVEKVITLLEEVEEAMDDASYRLEEHDTGGETIAAQTDVIEKIFEAAKERQKQCQGGSPGSAMMDMLQRMMGQTPDVDKEGEGKQPGDKGGEGMTGDSDAANELTAGDPEGRVEERRVPKASGSAGRKVPEEFRDALDAFNRGSGELAK